ncbi:MAG: hypothetical protein GXO83_06660 [Chlorobi bacterium]|nr:hypothetical protein [Chlorobiota bacterium]
MDKIKIKQGILTACLRKQEGVIQTARTAMEEALESANEEDQTRDLYDPYRTQMLSKRDMFAQQLEKAVEEKQLLEKLQPCEECDTVHFGSAVITDQQKLFVSIGLGKFEYNGETWYAISPRVPLYEVIKGKKKGDTFIFNGRKFTIRDVF